jgi:hypothetical protein
MADPGTAASTRVPTALLALGLAVAGAYWLRFGLTGRSITTDDGISLMAAHAIQEHGYPLLPSGFVYDRAYLAHYLLAGSTALLGDDVGMLVPAILFAVGALALVYDLGRRALGSPWIGLVAAAAAGASGTFAFYATSPRFYMPLAFFSILAVWASWRGAVEGSAIFRGIALLALAAGLQCELGAATLIPALAAGIVVSGRSSFGKPVAADVLGGLALAGSVGLLLVRPGNALRLTVSQAGRATDFTGFNLWPPHIAEHFVYFDALLPGTFPLLAVVALAAREPGTRFLAATWLVAALEVAVVMNFQAHRFVFFLLPVYALVVASGAAGLLRRREAWVALAAAVAVYAGARVWAVADDEIWMRGVYRNGWGLPEDPDDGHPLFRREMAKIRPRLGPDDLVLSSNPWVTDHYLGRTDGILRQRKLDDGWTTFEVDQDEYFGAQVVDDLDELVRIEGALAPGQALWLVADHKLNVSSSEEYRRFLRDHFRQVNNVKRVRVYYSVGPETP